MLGARTIEDHIPELALTDIDRAAPISPQIYSLLRRAIIQNRLKAGAPIFEAQLAESLGVSRTPLRAALQLLRSEGLVETRPQVGSIVAPVKPGTISSSVFCRCALETAVVRRLAGSPERDLTGLAHLLSQQKECTARDDYMAFFPLDERFHAELARLAGVPEAWTLVQSSKSHVDRARLHLQSAIPGRAAAAYQQHLDIVDAIRDGDGDRAADLMDAHVSSALDVISMGGAKA